jgi:hypothetical protein
VQKRILPITILVFFISLVIIGCSKLDTTDIGSDLLPAIDNINTFEKVFDINTTQGIFNDTTQVSYGDDLVLGNINTDPLFGTTKANLYLQFKPAFYPYYYGNKLDTITNFDSVVLCLSYKGFYGDSVPPHKFEVYSVLNNVGNNSFWDSVNIPKKVNYFPAIDNTLLGSATVDVPGLGTYKVFANHKDSVKNQIRIKLTNTAFLNAFFAKDSSVAGPNNSFRTDSLFKAFQNGFAVIATSTTSNSLLYTNLLDSSSRLEVHYKKKNGGPIDTSFSSFIISQAASPYATSAIANHIVRNRSTGTISSPASDDIYLQTAPGTYANLRIPALDTFSNCIINRAEIIIEQIPSAFDDKFSVPNYLYIDLIDTGANKWKPVYFDLNPGLTYDPDNKTTLFFPTSDGSPAFEFNFAYFGGFARSKTVLNNQIKFYNFNISRHVQQIVTKHTKNYNLRLYAPYDLRYPQYSAIPFPYYNRLANGRVKVGSGTNATYKMRLRIVYSKI